MKKCYFLLFLFIIDFLFLSCNRTEIIPAYLLLSNDDLSVNVANFNKEHETDYDNDVLAIIKRQYFDDVLVSLNGQVLGYWKLPCKIPLLPDYSKPNNIRVTPCTRLTNTTLTTAPYAFLKPIDTSLEIVKEQEYRLPNMAFEYEKSVSFPVLETFSQTTLFKPRDTVGTPVAMEIFNDGGTSKGRIALVDSLDYFDVITPAFRLYGQGVKQYWEMYYKCENGSMTTYLDYQSSLAVLPQQDLIVLPATTSWKKIYIDLTDVVSWACGSANSISLRLGIRGLKESNVDNAFFYFDYIKLITMSAPY